MGNKSRILNNLECVLRTGIGLGTAPGKTGENSSLNKVNKYSPKESNSNHMGKDSKATLIIERRYLTVKEVSDYTGLAEGTLYNMVSERRIPHSKIGRLLKFERYELDKWLKDQSVKVRRPVAA
jgi:excisionase family DNA binding protein